MRVLILIGLTCIISAGVISLTGLIRLSPLISEKSLLEILLAYPGPILLVLGIFFTLLGMRLDSSN